MTGRRPQSPSRTARIVGVDPGSIVTGWGLLGGTAAAPLLHESGVIRLPTAGSFAARLACLQREFLALVERLEPTVAAVEAPFHGKSSRSALQLAHARGVLLAVLAGAGVEVCEYTPAAVKKTITGSGRADKEQVRRMIATQLGAGLARRPEDQTDALAVALCHLAGQGFLAAVRRSVVQGGRAAAPRSRRRRGLVP